MKLVLARSLLGFSMLGVACMTVSYGHGAVPMFSAINGIVEQSSFQGHRYVELYGSFPQRPGVTCGAVPWGITHPSCYAVDTYCNGGFVPTYIDYMSSGQINVRFWELPTDTRCTFSTKASWEDRQTANSVTSAVEPLNPPHIEIFGVNDLNITAGRHYFEIYYQTDAFIPNPSTGGIAVSVSCDGASAFAATVMPGGDQFHININYPDVGIPKSCGFHLERTMDGQYSPFWRQQVNVRPALDSKIGSYHWGGFTPDYHKRQDSLKWAVQALRETGLRGPIRVVMDPKQNVPLGMPNNNYNIPPDAAGYHLGRAARRSQFANAFAQAGPNSRFFITALDGACQGKLADLTFMSNVVNQAAIKQEYKDFALALFELHRGSGREFIISNWEGDNTLFGFGRVQRGPSTFEPPMSESSITVPLEYAKRYGVFAPSDVQAAVRDRRLAMTKWFQLRKEAIDEARVEATSRGWTNVFVNDAIEFSIFRIAQERILGRAINDFNLCPVYPAGCTVPDQQDVLRGIVPVVRPRYAFYSAWETINAGRADEELKTIAEFVNPMGITLGVGEWGRQQSNDDVPLGNGQWNDWLLKETTRAMMRAPITAATTWEAFTSVDLQDGLLSLQGLETKSMRALRAGAVQSIGSPDFNIRAVQDSESLANQYVLTFYGSYVSPSSDMQVYARCGNDLWITGSTFTRTTTLVQTVFVNPPASMGQDKFCVFKIASPSRTSKEIGPYRLCRGPWNTSTHLCLDRGF